MIMNIDKNFLPIKEGKAKSRKICKWFVPRLTISERLQTTRDSLLHAPCTASSQHEVCWESTGPIPLHKRGVLLQPEETRAAGHIPGWAQPPCKEYGFKEDP